MNEYVCLEWTFTCYEIWNGNLRNIRSEWHYAVLFITFMYEMSVA
jgi:hypothetical protein